ncbi:competence protein CoiA [Alkalibacillus silvisoli]|uniref:Competence protein CoiA n=1 Tax=Alkalibacillus silvisoli TaxID=392823 RepID=A0ABP3JLA1_9BACI
MLKAVNANGQAVISFSQPKERLEVIRREDLFCPGCKKPVILKAGEVNIPHFAHRSDENCSHGQGESDVHLSGKMHLAKWLFSQKYPIYLEYFIKSIQQRADLITKVKNYYYAIEYQCSPIEPQEILARTEGFLSQQIIPIWIFGPSYEKPFKHSFYKVTPSIRTSLLSQPYVNTPRFFTYDSTQFTLSLHEPSIIHQNLAFTSSRTKPITQFSFHDLLFSEANDQNEQEQWIYQKRRFRTKQREFTSDAEKEYLNYLYEDQLHPQYLPSCIYLPVKNYHLFKDPIYIWQTHFILDIFNTIKLEEALSWKDIYCKMSSYFTSRLTSAYPNSSMHPLYDYVKTLVNLGYLEKNSDQYIKKKEVHFPKTLDEALKEDREVVGQLFHL